MGIEQEHSIVLDNISLDLPVYGLSNQVFKKELVRFATGGVFFKSKQKTVVIKALDGISLTINSGMRVGVIGHNGSGKSTLLRVIAGIYTPTKGSIQIKGKVSPLLDLMCGIDLDISGKDNVISRGMILGHSKKEILINLEALIKMTGLGSFIELPVRTYSAGMQVRLAFAVSVMFDPEILIIDEIFGAGDHNFAKESHNRVVELIHKSKIFVLASHNEEHLRTYCTHLLWLDKGLVRFFGDCLEGLQLYQNQ